MYVMEKIIWDDAGAFSAPDITWSNLEDVVESYAQANFLINTLGYVIYDDESSVIVAQSYDEEDGAVNYANCLRIPKGMIKERILISPLTALMTQRSK